RPPPRTPAGGRRAYAPPPGPTAVSRGLPFADGHELRHGDGVLDRAAARIAFDASRSRLARIGSRAAAHPRARRGCCEPRGVKIVMYDTYKSRNSARTGRHAWSADRD